MKLSSFKIPARWVCWQESSKPPGLTHPFAGRKLNKLRRYEAYLADCDKEKERSGIGWPVAMIFLILQKNDGRAKVRRVRFASQIES